MSILSTLFSGLRLPTRTAAPQASKSVAASSSSGSVGTPVHVLGRDEVNLSAPFGAPAPTSDQRFYVDLAPIYPTAPADATIAQTGQTASFSFVSGAAPANTYTVSEAGHTLEVEIPAADSRDQAQKCLGEIAGDYAMIPDANKGALKRVVIDPKDNPEDAYWAKQYNMPGFQSAATGGGGVIDLYDNGQFLRSDTFTHETGHNVANYTAPKGWKDAADADDDFVSAYAQDTVKAGTYAEDFAESYSCFCDAMLVGGKRLVDFLQTYPHRAQMLATIAYPDGMPDSLKAAFAQAAAPPTPPSTPSIATSTPDTTKPAAAKPATATSGARKPSLPTTTRSAPQHSAIAKKQAS